MIGPTAGETWIAYMGVPDEYPDGHKLAWEIDEAMWEAATDVLDERMAADPVLRAMRDDRYRLWVPVDMPVGDLPPGIRIEYRSHGKFSGGVVAKPKESLHPKIYAEITWDRDYLDTWHSERYSLKLDTVVRAWLPVPLDVSALIDLVAAEAGQDVPRPPRTRRTRPDTDWSGYAECTRPGCWAGAGAPCINVRTAWSTRRPSHRPHPGRPRLAERQPVTTGSNPSAGGEVR